MVFYGGDAVPATGPRGWFAVLASLWVLSACTGENAGGPRMYPVTDNSGTLQLTQFHVSVTGSPAGDGSAANPWDLATALSGTAPVAPGSVIWLHGGTYPVQSPGYFLSLLRGSAAAPVVVRQYPGERATIDGTLVVSGAYTWFWGFEVTNSAPGTARPGIYNYNSLASKFINLVVHDAGGSGISSYRANGTRQAEFYGSLYYNNGTQDNLDHGMYITNTADDGTVFVRDNVIFNNWAFGLHLYPDVGGLEVRGNVVFNNSTPRPGHLTSEILVDGPASQIVLSDNFVYRTNPPPTAPGYSAIDLGYMYGAQSNDVVAQNNYVVGGLHIAQWSSAIVTQNVFYDYASGQLVQSEGSFGGQNWSGNTLYGDPTAQAWMDRGVPYNASNWLAATGLSSIGTYAGSVPPNAVFVRANLYEAGRANIIVYNWSLQNALSVDLSAILHPGQSFVIRNVQDVFGTPVVSGTYDGGTVTIPTAGIPAPVPVAGRGQAGPVTGPAFNVFVVSATS
jgi:hypothetical protein